MIPTFQHWRRKTLKIYHVLEDLNYGIFRIYEEFWKKISKKKKVHVGCQKNLVHQNITIHRQIKSLEKSHTSFRSGSHELTHQQAQPRVDIRRQSIGNPMDDRFIRRILSHVMKNGSYHNTDASKQWLGPRQPAKIIVKKSV